jgi:Mg2+ and Co2+ transporter CorA
MFENEELLAKEADKIIKHVTEEKNNETMKLQAKNEEYGKLESVLNDKQTVIQSLAKEKDDLIKENEGLQDNNAKMIRKIKKKQGQIEELLDMTEEFKETIAQLKQ